jgi:hypothetical protein
MSRAALRRQERNKQKEEAKKRRTEAFERQRHILLSNFKPLPCSKKAKHDFSDGSTLCKWCKISYYELVDNSRVVLQAQPETPTFFFFS